MMIIWFCSAAMMMICFCSHHDTDGSAVMIMIWFSCHDDTDSSDVLMMQIVSVS